MKASFIIMGLVILASAKPDLFVSEKLGGEDGPTCGYESCPVPSPDMLNVHLVSHSHDDAGWLKTIDQYYYGSRTDIRLAGVQYIIDSVIQSLLSDPQKKFIQVESYFFFKWWSEQTEDLKEKVKMLVNEGRLEFTGGAWTMNDEATCHYQSVIDQFTYGLKRLSDTFGKCGRPKIGWQIDPFGHSRQQASIFAQMGFDGLFFGRLDYQDKELRLKTKTAEMVWRGSPTNIGLNSDLFTGALYDHYGAPAGFCFDVVCTDDPFIDDPDSPDYNVDKLVQKFVDYIEEQRKHFRTNNVIVTMGGDFNYQDANMFYKNIDKLIKYVNARQAGGLDHNLFYSTPSCYLKSLHDSDISWPTKEDDFFPYASLPDSYWTGYFTSRSTLKRYERLGNHFLQICKQITAMAPISHESFTSKLTYLREIMGILQHHDAVSGTEKEQIAYDYAWRLSNAIDGCADNVKTVLNEWVIGDNREAPKFEFSSCTLTNISLCGITENNDNFIVTLYNPLSHETEDIVRLPVPGDLYAVKDHNLVEISNQIIPVAEPVRNLEFRESAASNELIFVAQGVPALGYKSYYVSKLDGEKQNTDGVLETVEGEFTIGNEHITLTFTDGRVSKVSGDGYERSLNHSFLYYQSAQDVIDEFDNRSSGAYVFRPNGSYAIDFDDAIVNKVRVVRGPMVEEVHQIFNDWISQVIRVYKNANYAEFEWLVGPMPVEDGFGKEVVVKYSSDIASEGVFFTDSSGREMMKRVRDHRDTWDLEIHEPVAGNYYPLTTKISLEDKESRMSILVDRAQGGGSLLDGEIEIMLHRRILQDDTLGVKEPLNEQAFGKGSVTRGKHFLMVGPLTGKDPGLKVQERFQQLKTLLPSWSFLSTVQNRTLAEWSENFNNVYSGLTEYLPQNIHIMTLEPWDEDRFLIRFEHIIEVDEGGQYAQPVMFDAKSLFEKLGVNQIRETTLDGNQWIDEKIRFRFKEEGKNYVNGKILYDEGPSVPECDNFRITLMPMEMKTFIAKTGHTKGGLC